MFTSELELLKKTEDLCKTLRSQAEKESLQIELDAKQAAEEEFRNQELAAHRAGEALVEQARKDALLYKEEQIKQQLAKVQSLREGNERKIQNAAKQIVERVCSGNDCKDESIQPSDSQAG